MNHLRADEFVDALDEALSVERGAHLARCAECQHQVSAYAALLREVREASVPEPSPLFWDGLSDRVREAVAAERVLASRPRWFQWPVLLPLSAVALLVLALVSSVPQGPGGLLEIQMAMSGELFEPEREAAEVDTSWELVAALVEEADFVAAEHGGIATPAGTADQAVLQLSSAEQEELMRLLREELSADAVRLLRQELQGTGG